MPDLAVYLSAGRRDAHAEIRVRDNGQGIDAALLPHVFDLFVQGDRGADREQGGLGIGLTMARTLIEMHGGTIEAHSGGRGAGSEFVIALLLELDGHEVTAVHDGASAIEHANARRPDVALIDLGMPAMDGFEVARRLRAESSLGHTVLVALTGYGQEEDIRRSRDAGFDHHVTKSADVETLRRVLDPSHTGREA